MTRRKVEEAEIIEDAVDSDDRSHRGLPLEIAQSLGELWNVPRLVGKFVEWRLRNVPFWTRRPLFHSACFTATKFTGMAYPEFAIEINVSYNTRTSRYCPFFAWYWLLLLNERIFMEDGRFWCSRIFGFFDLWKFIQAYHYIRRMQDIFFYKYTKIDFMIMIYDWKF